MSDTLNQRRLASPISQQIARLRLPMPPKLVPSERFSKAFPDDAKSIEKFNGDMDQWWSQLTQSISNQSNAS